MAKYAMIINGDTESRHLRNVEHSLTNYFETPENGYETFVASTKAPSAPHDHYYRATPEGVQQMIEDLRSKMGATDELFIYTTGHGDLQDQTATLCLQGDSCRDEIKLTALLHGLPFQTRRVTFSADWCIPCKTYAPQFDKMAKAGGGQHVWLRTENADLASKWGVAHYPTVMIVSQSGRRMIVENRSEVEPMLAQFEVSVAQRLENKIAAAEKIKDSSERYLAFQHIASALADAGLQEKAAPSL